MKFKVIIIEDGENGVGVDLLAATNNEAFIKAVKEAIPEIEKSVGELPAKMLRPPQTPCKRGVKGNPVVVVGMEETVAGWKVGDQFESARAASSALGYTYSQVSYALAAAKRAGQTTALVRGVEFSYVADITARE